MAKVFGILLIVLGVWVGMEIFTKGTDGAFGGIFAAEGSSSAAIEDGSPLSRASERMQEKMDKGHARAAGDFGDEAEDENSDEE
jgi:hypothetical protein